MLDYQKEEWIRMIVCSEKGINPNYPLIEDEVVVAIVSDLRTALSALKIIAEIDGLSTTNAKELARKTLEELK